MFTLFGFFSIVLFQNASVVLINSPAGHQAITFIGEDPQTLSLIQAGRNQVENYIFALHPNPSQVERDFAAGRALADFFSGSLGSVANLAELSAQQMAVFSKSGLFEALHINEADFKQASLAAYNVSQSQAVCIDTCAVSQKILEGIKWVSEPHIAAMERAPGIFDHVAIVFDSGVTANTNWGLRSDKGVYLPGEDPSKLSWYGQQIEVAFTSDGQGFLPLKDIFYDMPLYQTGEKVAIEVGSEGAATVGVKNAATNLSVKFELSLAASGKATAAEAAASAMGKVAGAVAKGLALVDLPLQFLLNAGDLNGADCRTANGITTCDGDNIRLKDGCFIRMPSPPSYTPDGFKPVVVTGKYAWYMQQIATGIMVGYAQATSSDGRTEFCGYVAKALTGSGGGSYLMTLPDGRTYIVGYNGWILSSGMTQPSGSIGAYSTKIVYETSGEPVYLQEVPKLSPMPVGGYAVNKFPDFAKSCTPQDTRCSEAGETGSGGSGPGTTGSTGGSGGSGGPNSPSSSCQPNETRQGDGRCLCGTPVASSTCFCPNGHLPATTSSGKLTCEVITSGITPGGGSGSQAVLCECDPSGYTDCELSSDGSSWHKCPGSASFGAHAVQGASATAQAYRGYSEIPSKFAGMQTWRVFVDGVSPSWSLNTFTTSGALLVVGGGRFNNEQKFYIDVALPLGKNGDILLLDGKTLTTIQDVKFPVGDSLTPPPPIGRDPAGPPAKGASPTPTPVVTILTDPGTKIAYSCFKANPICDSNGNASDGSGVWWSNVHCQKTWWDTNSPNNWVGFCQSGSGGAATTCAGSYYCDPCNGPLPGTKDCSMPIPTILAPVSVVQAQPGTPFSYKISATNTPNTYSATGLPSSGSLAVSNGSIVGTPMAKDAGTYKVMLGATNNRGASNQVGLTLQIISPSGLKPPQLNISSPFNGQRFETSSATTFKVNASANNLSGSISSVQFQLDGVSLGSVTNAPYAIDWTPSLANNGNHTLNVTATDNFGLSTMASVSFSSNFIPPCLPAGAQLYMTNTACSGNPLNYSLCCSGTGTFQYFNLPGNGGSDPGQCDAFGICGAIELTAEQVRAEQVRAEQVRAEQVRAEQARVEQAKAEQIKAQQLKAEQVKSQQLKEQQIKAQQIKAQQLRDQQIKAEQLKAERLKAEKIKAEQLKAEKLKAEQLKAEKLKAEQLKAKQQKRK
jgi:hypothetical protein